MRRPFLFVLGLLLASTVSVGQTASADSQTLQALLAEVRQLRKDLRTTTVASQTVPILSTRRTARAIGSTGQNLRTIRRAPTAIR
jgi:hypothetical protein